MKNVQQDFARQGERMTKARLAVLTELTRSHLPVSAEKLHRRVKDADLVTIYRTLGFLIKQNLVQEIRADERSSEFELVRKHHHHVRCRICGRIADLPACDFENAIRAARQKGFKIMSHSFELSGVCVRHQA